MLKGRCSSGLSSRPCGPQRVPLVEQSHAPRVGGCKNRTPTLTYTELEICSSRSSQELRQFSCAAASTSAAPDAQLFPMTDKETRKGPKILIAGAGIGGLVLAVGLLKKGFDVQIFERDLTAIRGEGKYRGPIQVQSNALAALEAIDTEVAEKVLAEGCVTGDRINGLCDGVTGHWYVKFDTFHPAVEKGLPVTRVISRFTLQKLLAEACEKIAGKDLILNDTVVENFEEKVDEHGRKRVWAVMTDGRKYEGDVLIGADGIWSKVRTAMIGPTNPSYSQYTCYTGISDFTPPDINTVGYRVFLGNGQYFVSSDVGDGKMQWYAFHKEKAGGKDEEGKKKERLLKIFGPWTDMVTDLIKATPEEDVLRRDIFDRPPVFRWTKGHVALLGDSAHAMQPNLGQGGCMAIEDGFQLAADLSDAVEKAADGYPNIENVLKGYQGKRLVRASAIHGLAGSAAIMASTYKAYLGEGLGPLGDLLLPLKIPHPGKVGGYLAMNAVMPTMLSWVLGGNSQICTTTERNPVCHLNDKPKHFEEYEFYKFLKDERQLLAAADARWCVVPSQTNSLYHSGKVNRKAPSDEKEGDSKEEAEMATHLNRGTHIHSLRIAFPEEAVEICAQHGCTIGRGIDSHITLDSPSVSMRHTRLFKQDDDFWIEDLGSERGTWLNGTKMRAQQRQMVSPGDEVVVGEKGSPSHTFRIKRVHSSVWDQVREVESSMDEPQELRTPIAA